MSGDDGDGQVRASGDVLERGDAEVWVRPAVDTETDPEALVQVADLLVVLRPAEEGPETRVIEIGRKRFPAGPDEQPNWGFVRAVGGPERVDATLDAASYETATLGRRTVPAAQRTADGRYQLRRRGRDTLLALELGAEDDVDDTLLDQLHLPERGRYLLNVKNPMADDPDGVGLAPDDRAEYPDELQRAFDGNRWTAADPVALLDHEGAEFILVAIDDDGRA